MSEKPLSETDTRAKLIDPALHDRGWTEDLIRREETERGIEIIEGKPRRGTRGSEVVKAGGLEALKFLGEPKDVILDTKRKIFSS